MPQHQRTTTIAALERSRARLDLAGAGILAASILWTCVTAAERPSDVMPPVLIMLATLVAYLLGRLAGADRPVSLPAAVACVTGFALAFTSPNATAPPLGYGNANGALGVLGITAAVMAAVSSTWPTTRRSLYGLGLLLLLETAATTSLAATLLGVGVLGVGLVAPVARGRRLFAVSGLVLVLSAGVITAVVAARYEPAQASPNSVTMTEDALSARRVQLWHDAVGMVAADPVRGVGPGRFGVESLTARADPDARWAHSEPLQRAAEQGIPGVVLLAALTVWAYAALLRSPRRDAVVVCALAGLTAFVIQASVDYTVHFPVLPLVAALLIGIATAGGWDEELGRARRATAGGR